MQNHLRSHQSFSLSSANSSKEVYPNDVAPLQRVHSTSELNYSAKQVNSTWETQWPCKQTYYRSAGFDLPSGMGNDKAQGEEKGRERKREREREQKRARERERERKR